MSSCLSIFTLLFVLKPLSL